MVCLQTLTGDFQCSGLGLGARMRGSLLRVNSLATRSAFEDSELSQASSFTAIKLKRKGRTAEGHACDCTDKPTKKEAEASPLNLFKKEEKSTDQLAKELERERQQAERENADREMAGAFGEFEQTKGEYDKAMAELEAALKDFSSEQSQYETSFWLLKAIHDSECKKLMENHHLDDADCHKNWVTAREEYFARVLVPQCLKGETSAFELQVPPLAAVLAPVGLGSGVKRKEIRCFL
ncbi:unnamed protein product [Durusdinium trenchii]|uniref:Uncharacterized protein n=2 Tax=Durusdinium trenchii TaxID=1381693 RepID=A0ABP0JC22_9DINO